MFVIVCFCWFFKIINIVFVLRKYWNLLLIIWFVFVYVIKVYMYLVCVFDWILDFDKLEMYVLGINFLIENIK